MLQNVVYSRSLTVGGNNSSNANLHPPFHCIEEGMYGLFSFAIGAKYDPYNVTILCSISGSNCIISAVNKSQRLEISPDLGHCLLLLRGDVGLRCQTSWEPLP